MSEIVSARYIMIANFGLNYTEEQKKNFVKDLRIGLRLDYDMLAIEVRKLKDNQVIEKWYSINSLPENRIGGSNE